MDRTTAKEKAEIMLAYAHGATIECSTTKCPRWDVHSAPCFNWLDANYRVKPETKWRTWKSDEVPIGAQFRHKNAPLWRSTILGCTTKHVTVASTTTNVNAEISVEVFLLHYEHSTDGGKTWKPCGVMEEQ